MSIDRAAASAVLIKSIGCRTNQEEMIALGSLLARRGHCIVDRVEDADVAVVNTCFVTSSTEAKTRRYIAALSRLRPGIRICVTGCMAQYSPLEIKQHLPVTWVVGNSFKQDIPAILEDHTGGVFHEDIVKRSSRAPSLITVPICPDMLNRTRFFLKIQEGCDFRCAYCVVPLVRGPSASAPRRDVEEAFSRAVDAGYKEIILTGTHIGQYSDMECSTFTDLVTTLASHAGDYRIRLSSFDARDISDSLLEIIGSHPRLCRHLHISVQSFSAPMLRAMNRPIADMPGFIGRLISFRRRFPGVGLGGDFIVGFPGETEAMFAQTCETVAAVGFNYGHVFRYSKRPDTPASAMPGQIDEKEKNRRSARLREILDECHRMFIERAKGEAHTIVVETQKPVCGLASNYLRIEVPGSAAGKNSWLRVSLTGINPDNGRCTAAVVGE